MLLNLNGIVQDVFPIRIRIAVQLLNFTVIASEESLFTSRY